ncbi:hypothetical protein HIM_12001 [Hirsutella minnesotensis 3608]|uniref:Uncharacterized protein n=1 Tax=Hirsutella minnesotensis 3608 TaxID=1043627 RepID=A0A0F7ZQX3_9HYPO|nr:hypothetical protein HIM_12001 [Hirsutella minnesotensis 3608]
MSFGAQRQPFEGAFGQPTPRGGGLGSRGLASAAQATVLPKGVEPFAPPQQEPGKRQDAAPPEYTAKPQQGGEDTESNHSSHVVVSDHAEETRPSTPSTSNSLLLKEEFLEEFREIVEAEMRKIMLELVATRLVTVVSESLLPLRRKMDELQGSMREHERRLDAVVKASQVGDEVTRLSQDVMRLGTKTECVTGTLRQVEVDVKSIVSKIDELQSHQAQTSSTLEAVVLSRAVSQVEPRPMPEQEKSRHRSGSHSHSSDAGRSRPVAGGRSPQEDLARRERRKRREEENKRAKDEHRARSKDRVREKEKEKEKERRRGLFSLS